MQYIKNSSSNVHLSKAKHRCKTITVQTIVTRILVILTKHLPSTCLNNTELARTKYVGPSSRDVNHLYFPVLVY